MTAVKYLKLCRHNWRLYDGTIDTTKGTAKIEAAPAYHVYGLQCDQIGRFIGLWATF